MRLVLVVAAVLLPLPASAAAADRVTWPDTREYQPGETLKVKVANKNATKVVFVRETAAGKVMRVIARRTVRRATVSLSIGKPGRYTLRVGSATRRYNAGTRCARSDGDKAELRLDATSVRAGGALPYRIVNPSTNLGCFTAGVGYLIERLLGDGTWAPVNPGQLFVAVGIPVAPWQPFAKQALIPADAVPGTYRVQDHVSRQVPGAAGERIDLTAQFEVTAA
jgi:hypothetical protein